MNANKKMNKFPKVVTKPSNPNPKTSDQNDFVRIASFTVNEVRSI